VNASVGSTVVWQNSDSTLHHIVLDNGTDVGNLNPGATSRAISVTSSAAVGFHCTIHPSMVGTINGSTPASSSPDPNAGY
jgi:plastocyanin